MHAVEIRQGERQKSDEQVGRIVQPTLAEVESELVKDAYRNTFHIQCRDWPNCPVEHQELALAPGLEVGPKSDLLFKV